MNSLTKSIGGHGDALGGAITDTGLFDWAGYPNIFEAYRKGDPKSWGLQQVRKKGLRDMGGTLVSHSAHQIAVGPKPWPCAWNAPAPPRWRWRSGWSNTRPWPRCTTRCCHRTRNTRAPASISRQARGCCRLS